jgi:hypothetical protein
MRGSRNEKPRIAGLFFCRRVLAPLFSDHRYDGNFPHFALPGRFVAPTPDLS